ncbi:MAG: hypothetical protein V7K92_09935 [Nostoc sp.]
MAARISEAWLQQSVIAIANVDKIAWIWRRNQPAPQIFKGH